MTRPLALTGEGFQFARVKTALTALFAATLLAVPASAQVGEDGVPSPLDPRIEPLPAPDIPEDLLPELDAETPAPPPAPADEVDAPDYSRLSSNEERTARLDALFIRLKDAETEAAGKLVAEEIWAVWMRSGSPSVDFVLRRAAAAQNRGDNAKARALFDTVTGLQPGYAEGWARSGRLAMEERDFSRAIGDSLRALQHEPRHYYALWTLASVLERLGKQDEALEAYREANALYPTLEQVAERLRVLETELDGGVL